jgi:hypothetical protein
MVEKLPEYREKFIGLFALMREITAGNVNIQ